MFALKLIAWQKEHGRHNLPWQVRDPYKIWLSEIMLQQTQVESVKSYYVNFLNAFPTIEALSHADLNEVLALWAGLGYYARAKNLHKTAQKIVKDFGGKFPKTPEELAKLAGIGKSTASAIAVFAFGARAAILDGNVKRIFARFFLIDDFINQAKTQKKLWEIAEKLLPENDLPIYTQALMDFGSIICTIKKPKCGECPLNENCLAFKNNCAQALPKKEKIKRKSVDLPWFILLFENKIYLEKKSQNGIWGGLFCPVDKLEEKLNIQKEIKLSNFTHHLTHRILNISPKIIVLNEQPKHLKGQWFLKEEVLNSAIPSALAKLLKSTVNKSFF